MAINFCDSKTKENLMRAFAGESQARERYTIAAELANEKKMQSIHDMFLFTAEQEKAHGERFYEFLENESGETINLCAGYPVDNYKDLSKVLDAAVHNEINEYEHIYQDFGNVARQEGFTEIASVFYQIADIEKIHANRFGHLKMLLDQDQYYEKENGVWVCMNCGHVYEGDRAPIKCPTCRYDQGYFIPVELFPYTTREMLEIE